MNLRRRLAGIYLEGKEEIWVGEFVREMSPFSGYQMGVANYWQGWWPCDHETLEVSYLLAYVKLLRRLTWRKMLFSATQEEKGVNSAEDE